MSVQSPKSLNDVSSVLPITLRLLYCLLYDTNKHSASELGTGVHQEPRSTLKDSALCGKLQCC